MVLDVPGPQIAVGIGGGDEIALPVGGARACHPMADLAMQSHLHALADVVGLAAEVVPTAGAGCLRRWDALTAALSWIAFQDLHEQPMSAVLALTVMHCFSCCHGPNAVRSL